MKTFDNQFILVLHLKYYIVLSYQQFTLIVEDLFFINRIPAP
jgi:hypothetical protein